LAQLHCSAVVEAGLGLQDFLHHLILVLLEVNALVDDLIIDSLGQLLLVLVVAARSPAEGSFLLVSLHTPPLERELTGNILSSGAGLHNLLGPQVLLLGSQLAVVSDCGGVRRGLNCVVDVGALIFGDFLREVLLVPCHVFCSPPLVPLLDLEAIEVVLQPLDGGGGALLVPSDARKTRLVLLSVEDVEFVLFR